MNGFRKLAHKLRFLLWISLALAVYRGVIQPLTQPGAHINGRP